MKITVCRTLEQLLLTCVSHAGEGILPDDDPASLSYGWYFVESDLSVRISMSIFRQEIAFYPWLQSDVAMREKFERVNDPALRVQEFQEILRVLSGRSIIFSGCKHHWVTRIKMTENGGQWTTTKTKTCKNCGLRA